MRCWNDAPRAGAVAIALASVVLWSCSRPLPRDAGASVLLITLDTARADRLGIYGCSTVETPNLDGLAQEGAWFAHAVSSAPLTLPAHSSLMTGTYPLLHGVRDNGGFFLGERWTTLAEALKSRGFDTFAAVGAFVLHHLWGLDQGFDVYDDDFAGGGAKAGDILHVERDGAEVVDRTLAWLETHRDGRFFAWMHFYDPHHPYEPKGDLAERYRDLPYEGEIAYVDRLVGRVLDYLRANGTLERTLVVVVGDHGEGLGEHGEPDHGIFLYDSTLRVPLIVRTPSERYRGAIPALVRDIDVMPTILDYLGIETPPDVQGLSFLPLMAGRRESEPRTAYSETLYSRLHFGWSGLSALSSADYKLIRAPEAELYDLRRDLRETRNVIDTHPEIARRMSDEIEEIEERTPPPGESAGRHDLDPETLQKLMSLGYVGSAAPSTHGELPDPKHKLEEMNLLIQASRDSTELLESGRFREVVDLLERSLQVEPNYMDGYLNLASAYRELGQNKTAIAILERGLELGPENVNIRQSLARSQLVEKDYATAIALLESIIAASPRYAQAYYTLSEAYLELGRYTEAQSALERLLDVHPRTPAAEYEIGMIRLRQDDLDGAESWIEKGLRSGGRLPAAHFNLALIAERGGDPHRARSEYEKEIESFPRNLEARVNLGILCTEAGDAGCAQDSFVQAIALAPDFAPAHFLLAQALFRQGRSDDEVLRHARRAVDLDPSFGPARRLLERLRAARGSGG